MKSAVIPSIYRLIQAGKQSKKKQNIDNNWTQIENLFLKMKDTI